MARARADPRPPSRHAAARRGARAGHRARHPRRARRRGAGRGGPPGPAHQPRQGLLPRDRRHQAGPAAVLRRRRSRAAAPPARPGDGDEALPQRRHRRLLLHEARAVVAAGVAHHLRDRARLRQRDRLSGDRRPRRPAVGASTWAASTSTSGTPAATTWTGPTTCTSTSTRWARWGSRTVREAAGVVNETLKALGMPTWVKTTGSRGLHVYVPIVRGPTQKQVWEVSKTIALDVARRHGQLLTAVYKKAARPQGRVLVDYNQNAWGRTLASVYSVRPRPRATVSDPRHLGRGRPRLRDRRLPHRQPPRPPQEDRRPLVPSQHRQSPLRPHPPRLNLRTRLTSSTRASAGGVGARRGWRASHGPSPAAVAPTRDTPPNARRPRLRWLTTRWRRPRSRSSSRDGRGRGSRPASRPAPSCRRTPRGRARGRPDSGCRSRRC